jgi:hypothetical protein
VLDAVGLIPELSMLEMSLEDTTTLEREETSLLEATAELISNEDETAILLLAYSLDDM